MFNGLHLLKNSFYYLPKNTNTFEIGYNQLNKYLRNNPFSHTCIDYALEVNQPYGNIFWKPEEGKNDYKVNLNYRLTHYRTNNIHTQLHIFNSEHDIKEFFYIKPHNIYQEVAKMQYTLIYNGEKVYNFDFDIEYNSPYRLYKYAVFDKHRLYNLFSKKSLN